MFQRKKLFIVKRKTDLSKFNSRLPVSGWAKNFQLVDEIISDKDCWYWCVSAIECDGQIHLFCSRWTGKYEDWKIASEIVHFVSDDPCGNFEFVGAVLDKEKSFSADYSCFHNPQIFHYNNQYVLIFITFDDTLSGKERLANQKVGMLVSDNINGPWKPTVKNGIVLEKAKTDSNWTYYCKTGVTNPTLIYEDGVYKLYFKGVISLKDSGYGYAESDSLSKPFTLSNLRVTDNIGYIEDACNVNLDGTKYLINTDNFGINSGLFGALLIWKKEKQLFSLHNSQLFAGRLKDYKKPPKQTTYAINDKTTKLERPSALVLKNSIFLYGSSTTSMSGSGKSAIYCLRSNYEN